ncbi:hypothetical protein Tco_1188982, partial [Tanacetum coccineum]
MANGASGSISEVVVNGVMSNGVGESTSQVNGVSRSVPKVEANNVVANGAGVSRSIP